MEIEASERIAGSLTLPAVRQDGLRDVLGATIVQQVCLEPDAPAGPPVGPSLPADHLLWKKGMLSLMAGGTEEP